MIRSSASSSRQLCRRALAVLVCGSVTSLGGVTQPVDEFMTYDAAERTVRLTVVARYDESHSGYNLNGGFHGSHKVTVPVGWRVRVTFINRDVIPHSLGVVRQMKLVPIRIEKPAFAGAATRGILSGIAAKDRDDFEFVAAQSGPYLLACGVPGHAAIGGYLRFVIAADAPSPVYESGRPIARAVAGE